MVLLLGSGGANGAAGGGGRISGDSKYLFFQL